MTNKQKIKCSRGEHEHKFKSSWSSRKSFTESLIGPKDEEGYVLVNEGNIACKWCGKQP